MGLAAPRPTLVLQTHLFADIDKAIITLVFEEDARFSAFGLEVPAEAVVEARIVLVRAIFRIARLFKLVGSVLTYNSEENIQQPIAVVVKEDRGRGMSLIVEAGVLGNVFECAGAVVFKEDIAPAQNGHVEVWVAVVVDIGERGRYPQSIWPPRPPAG